jgi:phosphatidate cytidylyltransferase
VSELTRRTLFAVIAAPLGILFVFLGGAPLATMLGVISALGAWEIQRMATANGVEPLMPVGIVVAGLIPVAVHGYYLGVFNLSLTAGIVLFLILLASAIWLRGPARRPINSVALTCLGALYPGTIAYIYALRHHPYTIERVAGTVLVAMPILLTWATDTGAYFVGKTIGKRKLIPSVSPGKSVEGAVGGLVLTVIVSVLYARLLLQPYAGLGLSLPKAIMFGVIISVTAQVGDLVASLMKRDAGVKDSSKILPGHGGIVDRFDSLFFVMPVAFLLLNRLLVVAP